MQKLKKIKKGKIKIVLLLFIFSALIVAIIYGLFLMIKPYYSIKARSDNIKNYNESRTGEERAYAWIRVQGTNIDYPIIDSLLDYTTLAQIDGDFTWTVGKFEELPKHAVILGHNVRNLSANPIITDSKHNKFEQLPSFLYYNFIKDNKYVQLTINDKDYLFKIFSVAIIEEKDLKRNTKDETTEDFIKFINESIDDSIYDFDVDVNENDKVISLVTCTRMYGPNSDYDLKIDARMLREKEVIKNYRVQKNKNYEKIDKIMRGEENEQSA